jgi:hypothetical protein
MGEYEDRAKRYGLDVSFFQSLHTLKIEVPTASEVDIGFSTSPTCVLAWCFPGLRRYQIAPRLFVVGTNSRSIADLLRDYERVNSLLTFRSHRGDSRNCAIEYRGDKQAGAQHTHNDGQAMQAVIARSFAI